VPVTAVTRVAVRAARPRGSSRSTPTTFRSGTGANARGWCST